MNNAWFLVNKVSKNFSRLILFCLIPGHDLACYTSYNTGLLKKRTVQKREQKERDALLKEIGTENMRGAQDKVRGIQQLLETLDAENINHALTNIEHVRTEFKSTIERIRAESTSTLHHKDDELNKILTTLNVRTVDEAVHQIEQLQSSYQQIIRFAHHLDDNPNN